ncbi:36332_t:CDS:1, partial [Racocetra persica]
MSLFLLVYSHEAKLPIYPSQDEEMLEGIILQRLFDLMQTIPPLQERAQIQVIQQQGQVKDHHNKYHQISAEFKIGEKVLLKNVAKKYSHSDKFTPKYN